MIIIQCKDKEDPDPASPLNSYRGYLFDSSWESEFAGGPYIAYTIVEYAPRSGGQRRDNERAGYRLFFLHRCRTLASRTKSIVAQE